MTAGFMSFGRADAFPWRLDYDEIDYVLEGVLHITIGGRVLEGQPGDVSAWSSVDRTPGFERVLVGRATDFYDRTAAFALGGNAGVLWQVTDRMGVYGQLGLRWMSGLSQVDDLAGTGLEGINDNSPRWTMPIVFGTRVRF